MPENVIRREVSIAAPPATVFAFLTDPEKVLRWMGTSATLEPRPGGLYLLNVSSGNTARGEFKEVVPVHRLVYSWGWENSQMGVPPGSSQVEIDLIAQDPGTLLRFTHSGLPESAIESHTKGWDHYVARLTIAAAGGDPGPDPWGKDMDATKA
jgi:uncharacterized protein YndB with AHSA1/START domain